MARLHLSRDFVEASATSTRSPVAASPEPRHAESRRPGTAGGAAAGSSKPVGADMGAHLVRMRRRADKAGEALAHIESRATLDKLERHHVTSSQHTAAGRARQVSLSTRAKMLRAEQLDEAKATLVDAEEARERELAAATRAMDDERAHAQLVHERRDAELAELRQEAGALRTALELVRAQAAWAQERMAAQERRLRECAWLERFGELLRRSRVDTDALSPAEFVSRYDTVQQMLAEAHGREAELAEAHDEAEGALLGAAVRAEGRAIVATERADAEVRAASARAHAAEERAHTLELRLRRVQQDADRHTALSARIAAMWATWRDELRLGERYVDAPAVPTADRAEVMLDALHQAFLIRSSKAGGAYRELSGLAEHIWAVHLAQRHPHLSLSNQPRKILELASDTLNADGKLLRRARETLPRATLRSIGLATSQADARRAHADGARPRARPGSAAPSAAAPGAAPRRASAGSVSASAAWAAPRDAPQGAGGAGPSASPASLRRAGTRTSISSMGTAGTAAPGSPLSAPGAARLPRSSPA